MLRQIFVAFFFVSNAFAANARLEMELGALFTIPTSGAENMKFGGRLDLLGYPDRAWSPWVTLDTGLWAFGAVNPGAAPSAVLPDFNESHQGTVPFLLRTLYRSNIGSKEIRMVMGLTWYYADLKYPIVGSIPNAPTVGAVYRHGREWVTDYYAGLSYNPLGSSALLLVPEVTTRRGLFRAGIRIPVFRSFQQGILGVQPSISVGLALSI